ncbi:MAG: hypothetical protein NTX64_12920 [Elusimicrobia bacterium]|nr:hypothetical protein [Elusimicrobiota bacterium]
MGPGDLFYVVTAISPTPGLLVAIPFAVIKLHYPAWLVMVTGVPLAYVQVLIVDYGWAVLERWPCWRSLIGRKRSPRLERLAASRGAFIPTAVLSPIVGPWLIMAVMRYARVPQRRVMAPILLAISLFALATTALSVYVPSMFHHALASR